MVPPPPAAADDELPTWTTQTVKRDSTAMPNAELPLAFGRRVGDALLDWLLDRFNTAGTRGEAREGFCLSPRRFSNAFSSNYMCASTNCSRFQAATAAVWT